MKIVVMDTTLEVTSCRAHRYGNGKLVLEINIPDGVIGTDDCSVLLKSNTGDIQVLSDDDTVKEIHAGFRQSVRVSKNDDGTVYAEVENVSEAEFQNGILRQKITTQDEEIAELNATVTSQNETMKAQKEELELLNDTLLEVLME